MVLNPLTALGEEIGWRGFLAPTFCRGRVSGLCVVVALLGNASTRNRPASFWRRQPLCSFSPSPFVNFAAIRLTLALV
jgi:hypothetical protein